ncbi:hypothetical protein PF005_g24014 [Phytophthora fragariae]|uniref:C2H2-type domain-containing protein n=1 Tax=Phytophthora fragariae TaxID=53985 RepID=A0A6A3H9G8_9STRA|nr:hypothetical protein PF011_g28233 [Phytophthora fragariae]KAE9178606.1 hypothetical protein PF005_g24014 [Phytophthora fragariae]KAE9232325.1 hypothetical protein PF002_g12431 [Phytophthora fragariae]
MIMPKVFAAEMITTVRAKIEADDEFKTLDFEDGAGETEGQQETEGRSNPADQEVSHASLPGGEEQDPHQDTPAVEIGKARKKFSEIQAGLIIGLTENTKLVLYPKCFVVADPRRRTEVRLGAGDCVIFRGDVVHSGAAFTELNYKIHCVLVIKGIKWGADVTEFAPPPAYKCEFCPFMAPTKLQVSNHKRGCLRNPARAANRARDRELNKKGMFCCVCKKQFAKRNTYYKHYNRRHKPYLKL